MNNRISSVGVQIVITKSEDVADHIEFVDGVLTEEDRKEIEELLEKITGEDKE